MAKDKGFTVLSPTVLRVIDEFATAARADDGINNDAVERLVALLRKGPVAKADEIKTALFKPISDGEE